jgi:hypothetical protein
MRQADVVVDLLSQRSVQRAKGSVVDCADHRMPARLQLDILMRKFEAIFSDSGGPKIAKQVTGLNS